MSRYDPDTIRDVLKNYRKIVVVGLSPNPERASHGVTRYMIDQGYDVIGVRPAQREILGRPCYPCVSETPWAGSRSLEIVNVFRSSDKIPSLMDELIPLKPKVIWLQEGVAHPEAEERARKAGITVISDRCILKEHVRMKR